MNNRNYIQSLDRAFKILEFLGSSAERNTLTEIAQECDMNKTAANRFLFTLVDLGYIHRDENKRYSLTAKIMTLGFGFLNSLDLRNISKPIIDNLSAELNKTVSLSILDDVEVIYIYRKEKVSYLKYSLYDGSKLPAHCSSAGKVLLAGLNDSELEKRLSRLELKPITRRTITDRDILMKELLKIRDQGYAISDRELSMDLFAIATPIFDKNGKVVAAINITINANDRSKKDEKLIIDKLFQRAASISSMLGYLGGYSHYV